jgi:predicted lipid-binding transport protein (Tim44 family)
MTRHHSFLHPFGWGSLVGGALVAGIGQVAGTELGGLAFMYGILVAMTAAYLLIGLRIHAAVVARRDRVRENVQRRQAEASGA